MGGSDLSQVQDEIGRVYPLGRKLGHGGQGAVYEVVDRPLAVKLCPGPTDAQREQLRRQLAYVRRLPLDGLPLARPLELLRLPHVGYVMELMTGMTPLGELAWLPQGEPSPTAWYIRGGGLRRRLRLLARAADVLAELHSRGLVYGDPSPNNLLVSQEVEGHEVWLIDADNLHFSDNLAAHPIYTPPFGAPELVRGRGVVTTLTDAHALAVVVFQTLTMVHPLLGDFVHDGEPELEEQALRGELPWIDDLQDTRNRAARRGIPREHVLSPRLRELAQRAFGEGLKSPVRRPDVSDWAECLHTAADNTLTCPGCAGTYYHRFERCPWCDGVRPAHVQVFVHRWDPRSQSTAKAVAILSLSQGDPLTLTARTVELTSGLSGDAKLLRLAVVPRGVEIQPLAERPFWLARPDGQVVALDKRVVVPFQQNWRLHFRPVDQEARMATFRFFPEVKG